MKTLVTLLVLFAFMAATYASGFGIIWWVTRDCQTGRKNRRARMSTTLENMIKNAKYAVGGEYDEFILVPTEEPYDGFWGKNGYNCIHVFARKGESEWVRLDEGCSDVLWLRSIRGISFDVPTDYPCIRFTTDNPVQIDSQLSAINGHGK